MPRMNSASATNWRNMAELWPLADRERDERGEPGRAGVAAFQDMRQRRRHQGLRDAAVAQASEAPRARQAEPIEVTLLRVGMIRDGRRFGQRAETLRRESLQPALQLTGVEELGHEQRLRQARR